MQTDQNRTNNFFEAMIEEYTTCMDCIHYEEVKCGRVVSGGGRVKWTVPICKADMHIDISGGMKPCEKFKEGRDE